MRPLLEIAIERGPPRPPEVIAASEDADQLDGDRLLRVLEAIRCPAMVIHGSEDAIAPVRWGIRAADVLGAEIHVLEGAGHEPELREAAETNRLIDGFLDRVWPAADVEQDRAM